METSNIQISGELNRIIQLEAKDIYKRLERLRVESKFQSFNDIKIPTILILGNHSSGKSTFINHILGKDIQKTGRAPTDSTFTLITGGKRNERMDGNTLCRNNKYGINEANILFGKHFISQIELKIIANSPLLEDTGIMLIDSPGMIDPPGISINNSDNTKNPLKKEMDRGYNFKNVVHWFAERADLVLVMFDPDKPGTTFETLDVLTNSLNNVSSKVLLILNKVDDFKTIHDFARAYGTLCWNLSKVIPRKDMPFIYAMYVPIDENKELMIDNSQSLHHLLVKEFDGTRNEILREVKRAPDRSTDNIISDLTLTAMKLQMHCDLLTECRETYNKTTKFWKLLTIGIGLTGISLSLFYLINSLRIDSEIKRNILENDRNINVNLTDKNTNDQMDWKKDWDNLVIKTKSKSKFRWISLFRLISTTFISCISTIQYSKYDLKKKRENLNDWLFSIYKKKYESKLVTSDKQTEEIKNRWESVRPGLLIALNSIELDNIPILNQEDIHYLDNEIIKNIPSLNRSIRDRTGTENAFLKLKHPIHLNHVK